MLPFQEKTSFWIISIFFSTTSTAWRWPTAFATGNSRIGCCSEQVWQGMGAFAESFWFVSRCLSSDFLSAAVSSSLLSFDNLTANSAPSPFPPPPPMPSLPSAPSAALPVASSPLPHLSASSHAFPFSASYPALFRSPSSSSSLAPPASAVVSLSPITPAFQCLLSLSFCNCTASKQLSAVSTCFVNPHPESLMPCLLFSFAQPPVSERSSLARQLAESMRREGELRQERVCFLSSACISSSLCVCLCLRFLLSMPSQSLFVVPCSFFVSMCALAFSSIRELASLRVSHREELDRALHNLEQHHQHKHAKLKQVSFFLPPSLPPPRPLSNCRLFLPFGFFPLFGIMPSHCLSFLSQSSLQRLQQLEESVRNSLTQMKNEADAKVQEVDRLSSQKMQEVATQRDQLQTQVKALTDQLEQVQQQSKQSLHAQQQQHQQDLTILQQQSQQQLQAQQQRWHEQQQQRISESEQALQIQLTALKIKAAQTQQDLTNELARQNAAHNSDTQKLQQRLLDLEDEVQQLRKEKQAAEERVVELNKEVNRLMQIQVDAGSLLQSRTVIADLERRLALVSAEGDALRNQLRQAIGDCKRAQEELEGVRSKPKLMYVLLLPNSASFALFLFHLPLHSLPVGHHAWPSSMSNIVSFSRFYPLIAVSFSPALLLFLLLLLLFQGRTVIADLERCLRAVSTEREELRKLLLAATNDCRHGQEELERVKEQAKIDVCCSHDLRSEFCLFWSLVSM